MPSTLANVLSRVDRFCDADVKLIHEFYYWMKDSQISEAYQKNNFKAIINFSE
ncbi:MAG TPA: hypothetical protein VNI77_02395 [Nitrososphaera sp.]|nr:hypothetical protein [Nitrososphaera sp.]